MRDLRTNIRDLNEPIIVKNYIQVIVDYIPTNSDTPTETFTVYGNVMLARKKQSNSTTGTDVSSNDISVLIRRNTGKNFTIGQTIIEVRGVEYNLRSIDLFGINQEYQTLDCVLRND